MKFFLWYIERRDYKAQLDVAETLVSKYYEEKLAFLKDVSRLREENKKLRSEVYSLKNAIRKKKRERRKPIVQKAKQMAKEMNVEIPYFGEVE